VPSRKAPRKNGGSLGTASHFAVRTRMP
jgi:hypothetical protein